MSERLAVIGDSEYGEWRDRLELPTTMEQDLACLKLERRDLRFLVDFGYENAIEILRVTRLKELAHQRGETKGVAEKA